MSYFHNHGELWSAAHGNLNAARSVDQWQQPAANAYAPPSQMQSGHQGFSSSMHGMSGSAYYHHQEQHGGTYSNQRFGEGPQSSYDRNYQNNSHDGTNAYMNEGARFGAYSGSAISQNSSSARWQQSAVPQQFPRSAQFGGYSDYGDARAVTTSMANSGQMAEDATVTAAEAESHMDSEDSDESSEDANEDAETGEDPADYEIPVGPRFQCPLCPNIWTFGIARDLLMHMRSKHNIEAHHPTPPGPFHCPLCNEAFPMANKMCAHFKQTHCLREKIYAEQNGLPYPPIRKPKHTGPNVCYRCPRCVPEMKFAKIGGKGRKQGSAALFEHLLQVHGFDFQRSPADGLIHCPFCCKAVTKRKVIHRHLRYTCCNVNMERRRQQERAAGIISKGHRHRGGSVLNVPQPGQEQGKRLKRRQNKKIKQLLLLQAKQLVTSRYEETQRQGLPLKQALDAVAAIDGGVLLTNKSKHDQPTTSNTAAGY